MKSKWLKGLVVAGLTLMASFTAHGFAKTMYPYELPAGKQGAGMGCTYAEPGMKLELGQWYTNWKVCKDYCDKNGIPLVMVWSNATCIHCWYCDICFIQDEFKQWAATHNQGKVIYCFMAGSHSGAPDQINSEAYNWMYYGGGKKLLSYPFTVLWWKKKDVNVRKTGDQLCDSSSFTDASIPARTQSVIANMEAAFADWVPPADFSAGSFVGEETESHRLEAEAGTTSVPVTLMRDDSASAIATNGVISVQDAQGKELATVPVEWKASESNQTVSVEIPAGALTKDGEQLTLVVMDADGQAGGTNHITYVEAETSAVNPLWIGERKVGGSGAGLKSVAASPLAWGEWTMDLDVAKQTVAAAEGNAYTLALVEGSLWCSDCEGVYEKFLSATDAEGTNRFVAWAASKQIALVAIDVPRFETNTVQSTYPTLLSREAREASLGVKSGLGYLSRKGATDEEAAEVLERNRQLVSQNTAEGGFHRPEDGSPYRTGVPIFVLLRKDGTVAARLTRFSAMGRNVTTDNWDNYIKRFEEMLKIADDDVTEVENNYPSAGSISFKANGGSALGELSNADFQDTFKLDGVGGNALQKVTVKGTTPAEVGVTFKKLVDGVAESVGKTVYGSLQTGVNLENIFTEAGDYYVEVKGKDIAAAAFDVASVQTNNVHPFTISGNVVLVPQEAKATGYAPEDSEQVMVRLEAGQFYRLEGVKATDAATLEAVTPQDAEDPFCKFYTAKVTGDQAITLAYGKGGPLSYQKWAPGEIGFVVATNSVTESAGEIQVAVARTTGTSGHVKVRVSLDETATDLVDFEGNPRFEFTETDLEWADGESFTTNVVVKIIDDMYFDGNGQVVLKLEILEDENKDTIISKGKDTYALVVKEDERQNPGRATVSGVDSCFALPLTVYAKQSDGATIRLQRVKAAAKDTSWTDGMVAVAVTASDKTVKLSAGDGNDDFWALGEEFGEELGYYGWQYWKNRDDAEKSVHVANLPAAGKSTVVTLAKVTDKKYTGYEFPVLAASNKVTVVSIADDAPEFAETSADLALYRYVACSNLYPLASTQGGKVTFKKLSGTLPAGLKVTYDAAANALALAGIPTAKAGFFPLTFQVVETRGTKAVSGLVLSLAITVVDPTDVKYHPETANPAIAKSRTFKDLPVIDTVGQRLAGRLQVTIPATGKASAKYVGSEGNVSLSAKSWSAFDPETMALTSTLTTKAGHQMELIVEADGSVTATLESPKEENTLTVQTDGTLWSKTNSAADWKGYYTVALPVRAKTVEEDTEGMAPRGTGYLTLKMDTSSAYNAGKVTWAGLLPNGTKISGSTILTRAEQKAVLPIFTKSATDEFSALAEIQAGASENREDRRSVLAPVDVTPYWVHTDKVPEAKADYAVELDVFGGIYDKAEDLVTCCDKDYRKTDFDLSFDTSAIGETMYGSLGIVTNGALVVSTSTMKLTSAPAGMTLTLARATGIVTGSVRLPYGEAGKYITAKYAGVVLTGWGDGCGCLPDDTPVRPLVNGMFYFTDKISYEKIQSGKTVTKTQSVVRAGDVKAE